MTLSPLVPTPQPSWPAKRAYRKLFKLASGGMGTVHVGVLEGAMGFRHVVALKEAHAHLLEDPQVRRTLVEEARLAARIHHANVVEVRDVEVTDEGFTLVMPYIDGASLADLWIACVGARIQIPAPVALRIALDSCAGLAAAHALTDEEGAPLGIVHRDVSPQNLLIGADGVTRVSDFGVAKHRRSDGYSTTHGTFKGKLAYSSPEVLRGQGVDARHDVFSMGVVLWELLTMERLFMGEGDLETLERVQRHRARKVSMTDPALAPLDHILEKALEKSKNARTETIAELASSLERVARGNIASHRDVAALLTQVLGSKLDERRALIRERLRADSSSTPSPSLASAPPVSSPNTATLPVLATAAVVGIFPRRRFAVGASIALVVSLVVVAAFVGRGKVAPPSPTSQPSAVAVAAAAAAAAGAATFSAPATSENPGLPPVEPSTASAAAPTADSKLVGAPATSSGKARKMSPTRAGKRGGGPGDRSSAAPSPPPNPY